MKACRHQRCPNAAVDGTGYCQAHQRPPRQWGHDKRLNAYRRGYGGAEWTKTRMRVFYRDRVCCFCGEPVVGDDNKPTRGATVHHLIPRDDGGTDDMDNLTACHKACHERHHGRKR